MKEETEHNNQQAVLIKLGGSVITYKDDSKRANVVKIEQLADEIHRSRRDDSRVLVVGHGAGSFGHPQASRYRTIEGLFHSESRRGMVEVRNGLSEIHTLVIDQLVRAGEYPISLPAAALLTSKGHKLDRLFIKPVVNLLEYGLLPVTSGDVVTDNRIGCTIFSGEQVLNFMAMALLRTQYKPSLIIEVSDSRGVEDRTKGGETIPVIDQTNVRAVLDTISSSSVEDVTGGMVHKIKEAFMLTKKGIPTLIISSQIDNLYRAIKDLGDVEGTLIRVNSRE